MTAPDLREVLATAEVIHDRATLEAAIERMADLVGEMAVGTLKRAEKRPAVESYAQDR